MVQGQLLYRIADVNHSAGYDAGGSFMPGNFSMVLWD